jgi:hypothetical protein
MKRLRIAAKIGGVLTIAIFSLFAPGAIYRFGMSQSVDSELTKLELEIKNSRAASSTTLGLAQNLRDKQLGNEDAARRKATWLANDPRTADYFKFLSSQNPVEDALNRLPQVFDREDDLLRTARLANSGIGRLNAPQTLGLLSQIKDLHYREERGYRTILRAFND